MRRLVGLWCLGILLLAGGTGCAKSDGEKADGEDGATGLYQSAMPSDEASRSQADDPSISATADEPDPMAEFEPLTEEQWEMIGTAQEAFVKDCMTKEGFTYTPNEMTSVGGDDDELRRMRRDDYWGPPTEAAGAKYGYRNVGLDQGVVTSTGDEPTHPPGYEAALWGQDMSTLGGCLGAAEQALNDGTPNQEELDNALMDMWNEPERTARNDSRMGEVSVTWSACMADSGYTYSSPHEAMATFVTITEDPDGGMTEQGGDATPEEKTVAAADGACKEKVGFDQVRRDAVRAATEALIEERRPLLEQAKQAALRKLDNATAIIATLG